MSAKKKSPQAQACGLSPCVQKSGWFACSARLCEVFGLPHRVAEALEVHDLALPQELERLAHVGVVDQAQQVVVGCAGLLLWYYHVERT